MKYQIVAKKFPAIRHENDSDKSHNGGPSGYYLLRVALSPAAILTKKKGAMTIRLHKAKKVATELARRGKNSLHLPGNEGLSL
jgi:hypothetical protein